MVILFLSLISFFLFIKNQAKMLQDIANSGRLSLKPELRVKILEDLQKNIIR